MRLIELSFPEHLCDKITTKLGTMPDAHYTLGAAFDGKQEINILASNDSQPVIDALQELMGNEKGWQIVVLPVEAAIRPQFHLKQEEPETVTTALREEIYQDVSSGARLNSDFIILTILSTIVAAIGMNANNIAVVIGAMVIAPLLGPLLAFSFASALGDIDLMLRSARTALAGLGIGIGVAFLLSFLIEVNLQSPELLNRSILGLDIVALAIASGAAAALSIALGRASTLVGVMVAVALLPPSVALAMFVGVGEYELGARAALLLAMNIVSVNIASQVVFVLKGIRPRTWLERRSAKKSKWVNMTVWGVLLAALILLVLIKFS